MSKKIDYTIKESIICLSGTCFWYWGSFYSFLESCGVTQSIYKRYPKDNKYQVMRNVLEFLEESGNGDIINNIISSFYKMRKPLDKDVPDQKKAVQLLNEFREQVGNDPIEKELERRNREASQKKYVSTIKDVQSKNKRLEELNSLFTKLFTSDELTPQQKGYKLEDIFCDLLRINEIEYSPPFRHTGEQIDGHFKYDKFDYLIEAKWEQDPAPQSHLSIFDGKIRGKAQSTRGLFIAINGFDPNAINKFSGDSPRIILMTGEDLALVSAIVKHGNIHFLIKSIAV